MNLKIYKPLLIIAFGLFLMTACCNNSASKENKETPNPTSLLVGSWEDTSEAALHFSLYEDGTAASDNMHTLLYKNWSEKENEVTFIIESIGNKISSIDTITYHIEKLTEKELVLSKDESTFSYKRK